MPNPTLQIADDASAIVSLAKTFAEAAPANTRESTVFSAAIAFICTFAEVSPQRAAIANLMRSAGDELLSGDGTFPARHR